MKEAKELLGKMGWEQLAASTEEELDYVHGVREDGIVDYTALLELFITGDLVQQIYVGGTFAVESGPAGDIWNRSHSVRSIFQQLGKPDRVFINADIGGRSIRVVYKDLGAIFSLYSPGWRWGKGICTGTITDQLVHFGIHLNDVEGARASFYSPHGHRIKEIVGMDEQEFYERVLSDPEFCFTVPGPLPTP